MCLWNKTKQKYHISIASNQEMDTMLIKILFCESGIQELIIQEVSEYGQEIPQSHNADQRTASQERVTEHLQ